MSDSSVGQLEKTLDKILSKIETMDKKLMDIVRVEERLGYHNETLERFGRYIDSHEKQIHDIQLESVKSGNAKDIAAKLERHSKDIKDLDLKIDSVIAVNLEKKGKEKLINAFIKWVAGILATVLAFIAGSGLGK